MLRFWLSLSSLRYRPSRFSAHSRLGEFLGYVCLHPSPRWVNFHADSASVKHNRQNLDVPSSYKSLFCQRCLSRKAQRKRNSIGGGLSGISSTACGIDLKSLSPSSRNPCVLQQTQTVTQACHQTCTHIPSDSSVTS
ncbi:hypothetical protein RRG08_036476 [Elysia crispata]|uniref:Uncharacterized protein n=1 Tax=Elysia crispata TaxID=231223 RepID=A0AAE0ZLB3_9GAST|nr:hypothetical protein RRG08_036476 [Elysia crispata]